MAARVAVALVALAVIAALAVMERDERTASAGVDAVARGDFGLGIARLRSAGALSPATEPDVARARALALSGQAPGAILVLDDVVRREPDNLAAWGAMLSYARGRDPAAARRAFRAVERLDPVSARRLRLLRRR